VSRSTIVWGVVALAAMLAFLWAATTQSVYDHTSPGGVARKLLGEDAPNVPHNHWLSLHILMRKAYSIVAFAIVGFIVDKALPPVRRRALRAVALVATFSALIEVVQVREGSPEGFASNVFDVGCGAVGGWLGVALVKGRKHGTRTRKQDRVGDWG
jgi:hypothetical protein